MIVEFCCRLYKRFSILIEYTFDCINYRPRLHYCARISRSNGRKLRETDQNRWTNSYHLNKLNQKREKRWRECVVCILRMWWDAVVSFARSNSFSQYESAAEYALSVLKHKSDDCFCFSLPPLVRAEHTIMRIAYCCRRQCDCVQGIRQTYEMLQLPQLFIQ